ncbi:hypothetical protein BCR36DRAFT_408374 [Piromyces finnis]|uniref:Uncharacterized protein n=1 Tax=Piromyces finnis TaxID=1754191 RepID=A0A1Y1VM76_9FUNG|nr:hypothetical protein BCR36DRAFT_408374 [Piromyces finnis]|eukprot:ORX60008.1 hypothetical protein BCR36DRAFT_408374 [Piromyces finnis]
MVFSNYSNKIFNDLNENNKNVIDSIEEKYSHIKTFLNFDKNCNSNDNLKINTNDNINHKYKNINKTVKLLEISKKINSNMNSNNISSGYITEKIKKISEPLKNEKINKLDKKLPNNESVHILNNGDKIKISKKVTNVVLKNEKDITNTNEPNHNKEKNIAIAKLNESFKNQNKSTETIKRTDCKCNGTGLMRPLIERRPPPHIPTISDNKKIEQSQQNVKNSKIYKNIKINNENIDIENEKLQPKPESTSLSLLKPTLRNSQSALIANVEFKTKKEMTNKRIVKAITKYKPVINVTSPNDSTERTFHIYKSAHLDFCRNCLIPKDVLYFQGLLLFKNVSKLKGMNLSRQQINNALEWEVIKYTVFNSKSTENWTNLLNQYKNDRTSNKLLTKRYAARKQNQKCIKKETENYERKFIAFNIIKKKAQYVINHYNSRNENTLVNKIRNKDCQDNNTKSCFYSDIESIDDYKRIFSKVVEQRVKVNVKNWTSKSSPLKECSSINYSTKIIKTRCKCNKTKNKLIIINVNDMENYDICVYSSKLLKNTKFCSIANENEIINNLLNFNNAFINNLYNNFKNYDFNTFISSYIYYLLNITYISLPYMKTRKIKSTGLDVITIKKLYSFLINLINENLYDFNNNYYEIFIKFVNYIAKVNSVESEPTPTLYEDKIISTETGKNILLMASEKSKLICIRYLIYYLKSPKNKISSTINHKKVSKLIHIEFLPKISYAINTLNSNYLKKDKNYRNCKRHIINSQKKTIKPLDFDNNDVVKNDKFICNINNYQNNNIIINSRNISIIDTIYPSLIKKDNYIQVNKIINYKNIAIRNHHQYNNNKQVISHFSKYPYHNKNNFGNIKSNYQKLDFSLPVLNNNMTLMNNYKKIVTNSYITYPSLRHRKTYILSSQMSYNDNQMEFFLKKKNMKREKQYAYKNFFQENYLRHLIKKEIKKKKRKYVLKIKTLKSDEQKNQKLINKLMNITENHIINHHNKNIENLKFLYTFKIRRLEYRNKYNNNKLIHTDKDSPLKSKIFINQRINRSKTNLLKTEKKKKNKAIKIYENYSNPDEDKINYIKRIYKKKYKKLISNEKESNSDSTIFNYNDNNKEKDIFYLEFYNTKNDIIDLNKNILNENNNAKHSIPSISNEKITIEFIKKKYNIIDLNQRINDSSQEVIYEYNSEQESHSLVINSSLSIDNISKSYYVIPSNLGNIESKSTASLSISEITSKESLNHIISSTEKAKYTSDIIDETPNNEPNSISNEFITKSKTKKTLSLRSLLRNYTSTLTEKENQDSPIEKKDNYNSK